MLKKLLRATLCRFTLEGAGSHIKNPSRHLLGETLCVAGEEESLYSNEPHHEIVVHLNMQSSVCCAVDKCTTIRH